MRPPTPSGWWCATTHARTATGCAPSSRRIRPCPHSADARPSSACRSGAPAFDVVLGQIGDVLPRRGLRFPPDDWGTTSVIWRKDTFRAPNAVPDSVRRPPPRPPKPTRTSTIPRSQGTDDAAAPHLLHGRNRPRPGRLLHEPRAVLAGGCAYCTNPRTPRSTPTPRPVGPDPRALRPGEVGTPVSSLARARANPRQRFSYQGFE